MAMITQAGVDRFTAEMRERFALENEEFDRAQRLKRAARGGSLGFDPSETAERMERLRQQDQDLRRAEQGVRKRYSDGKEFQGSMQLFDADDISILPASVLARHGHMSRGEMVRTERDRVNGGGTRGGRTFDIPAEPTDSKAWNAEDDFNADLALGSRKMARDAAGVLASAGQAAKSEAGKAAEAAEVAKKQKVSFEVAKARETLQQNRRRGNISFDPSADPLRADTVLAVKRDTADIPTVEFDNLASSLSARQKLIAPTVDAARKEEAYRQSVADRNERIKSREVREAAARQKAAEAAAKERLKAQAAFDKGPEGRELAGLRTSIKRDEEVAAKKLGVLGGIADFGRSIGAATPEAEAAARRLTRDRERLQALERRRAGASPDQVRTTSAGEDGHEDGRPSASGAYSSPFAKEIEDLSRQIDRQGSAPGSRDTSATKQRRLQLQAMELQDMMKKGFIDRKEADRRAAELLRQ